MIYNFEDLVIWQLARVLVRQIYANFQNNRDYGFRDQIQRASISIMNNIAEGFQRNKYTMNNNLFISFLGIALGSCSETKSMLYIAEDLQYIPPEESKNLREQCVDLEYKMNALITSLRNHPAPNPSQTKDLQ